MPEFPQSMGAEGGESFIDWPWMRRLTGPYPGSSSMISTFAPRARMALRVLTQSSLGRKLRRVQMPLERPPRMAARCDMLLSPGTLNSAWRREIFLTRKSDMG